MNNDVLNIFCFVATYHGAVVEHLSNLSWKYFWGWDCDHPRHSWYGKAMRKLWEGHKPHLRERSCLYGGAIGMEKLWESYGNSRNIILLHKVFHSSMKKCYEKPRPNFFLLWETAAGIIPAMVPWARQYQSNNYWSHSSDKKKNPEAVLLLRVWSNALHTRLRCD